MPLLQTARPPQASEAPPGSNAERVVKDVSVIAMVIVIAVVIIVVVSVSLLLKLLRGLVDNAGKVAPTFECTAWLLQRQQSYLSGRPPPTNPATNQAYTICEATKQAINDAQLPANASVCPVRKAPPDVHRQSPYVSYMASQGCSGA
jgi:hypothetical protein